MSTLLVCQSCEKVNRLPMNKKSAIPICGNCKAELPFHGGVQDLTDRTLKKLLEFSGNPVVVDFWAEWCGPCKMFAPVFSQVAQEMGDHFAFGKLNTELFPSAAQDFHIRGIPTLIVFHKGKEVHRQSGALSRPAFLQYLNQWKVT